MKYYYKNNPHPKTDSSCAHNDTNYGYDHYDPSYIPDNDTEKDELYPRSGKRFYLPLIASIILISFVVWSFPQLGIFFVDFSFMEQNDQLKNTGIVKSNISAVVSVESANKDGGVNAGTGFNIAPEGLILTNYHVVENSQSIKIEFSDGNSYFSNNFKQIGLTDMAMVRLNASDLPSLPLGLQHDVATGDEITIIGNPLGFRQLSVRGEVVAFYEFGDHIIFVINALVSHGNSGSPAINSQGQAVGIVFARMLQVSDGKDQYQAVAIPLAYYAEEIMKELDQLN